MYANGFEMFKTVGGAPETDGHFWNIGNPNYNPLWLHRTWDGMGGDVSCENGPDYTFNQGENFRWVNVWIITNGRYPELTFRRGLSNDMCILFIGGPNEEIDGKIEIRQGARTGTLVATSTGTLDFTEGHWFQFEVFVAPSGGCVRVYVDDDADPFVEFEGNTATSGPVIPPTGLPAWDKIGRAHV